MRGEETYLTLVEGINLEVYEKEKERIDNIPSRACSTYEEGRCCVNGKRR